ncbi:MAG: DUF2156 domain-containing protein [Nitrospira sp. CR1.3]|nr:DUF2156 domain-containing protein [Nitrospira sp. CR1.3]
MAAPITQISSAANPVSSPPQMVPSSTCLRCDVCCRFPDPDSPLRPYFTGPEVRQAVAAGVEADRFPSPGGGQISLVPDEQGEGFHCPAFNPVTSVCKIYEQRPLDCRLYPLVLMWNERHDEVMLGWDSKCPFMRDQVPDAIRQHADRAIEWLNSREVLAAVSNHLRLIGRFQADVAELSPLPAVTLALSRRWGKVPIHRLTLDDVSRLTAALHRSGLPEARSLAAYSAPYHYLCGTLLSYWWAELDGAFCLFVESPDGWFMPLPPLTKGPIEKPIAASFEFMRRRNGDSAVSRIENISELVASRLRPSGYRLVPKDGDYLYRAEELAALAGDRFKSQRALCNRIERMNGVAVTPYALGDRAECRKLLQRWRGQKRTGALDSLGRLLLDDALSSHEIVWSHAFDLRLSGTVVRIDGTIRAYTFGYWLTGTTWCVLLEVADRTVSGLAQYLFRDTCRAALSQGAEFINTMDDAGLPGLGLSKRSYHPVTQVQNFILTEDRGL